MNKTILHYISLIFHKHWLPGCLLLLHVIASYYYISKQDMTFDEPQYLEYAKRWLQGKPERVYLSDDSKSPVIAICWIPRIIQQTLNPGYNLTDGGHKDQVAGRFVMIFFSLITALYVYWWCKELYGQKGWFLPLLLLLFDPLYLAYSTIITTDLACAAFLTATLYHYRKYLLYKQQKHFYASAILTGIGIVTKASLIYVIILLPALALIYYSITRQIKMLFTIRSFVQTVLYVAVTITVINLLYYFHSTFIPLSGMSFISTTFRNMQNGLSGIGWIRVPLPSAFIQSLDLLQAQAEIGAGTERSTYNGVYLFGELKMKGTFWYYYFVLLFYKLPIGTMILCTACLPLFIKRFRISGLAEKYLFLLLPIVFFWIILSFFNPFQTGIRHILLIFPLLFIGLGKLFQHVAMGKAQYKILTSLAVIYTFISVATFYPYLIPYSNEFITDKKTVYKKILDTSIDYNQVHLDHKQLTASHPGYKVPSPVPDTGKYAITMNQLFDKENWENSSYNWYKKLKPTGLDKYVVLLYDIKPVDLVEAGLKPK